MYLNKIFLYTTFTLVIILLGGLFNIHEGYLDKTDIIIVSICSLIITYFNNSATENKAFVSFIIFYFYTLSYLIPIIFFAYYPEYYTLWFGKYTYVEFSISKIFVLITVIIALIHLILRITPLISINNRKINFNLLTQKSSIFSIFFLIVIILINQSFTNSFFIILFNVQALALILMVGVLNQEIKEKKYVFIFFIVFVLSTIFGGSRGGILNVIFNFTVLLIFFKGNVFIKKKYIVGVFYFLIIAVITYPISTFIRFANENGIDLLTISIDSILTSSSFVGSNPIEFILSRIVDRLDLFKYSFVIFNNLYDPSFFAENLSFINIFKSSINLVLPGDYFDVLASNNYFQNLVNNRSVYEIKDDWSSGNLSFFDYNILRFGKYIGILSIFFFFYFYFYFLNFMFKYKNLTVKIISIYLVTSLLKIFVFFGYDYLIRDIIHFSFAAITYVFILRLIKNRST